MTDAHRLATRRLIDAGEARLQHPYGHDTEIVAHAMSPDGRYLATGSWVGDDYDAGGVLQIWEVATGRCVNTVRRIDGGIGWPRYARTIQWSADSSRIAMAHRTNMVGVWTFDGEPLATIDVSDGNSRPSDFALSPDGRSVYFHCGTNGDGGLQGCIVPLDRGHLSWLPDHVETDHPYLLARPAARGRPGRLRLARTGRRRLAGRAVDRGPGVVARRRPPVRIERHQRGRGDARGRLARARTSRPSQPGRRSRRDRLPPRAVPARGVHRADPLRPLRARQARLPALGSGPRRQPAGRPDAPHRHRRDGRRARLRRRPPRLQRPGPAFGMGGIRRATTTPGPGPPAASGPPS
ncbi:WD40 repeat domain-containing protein [Actinomadura madurae]|uniref:WD40 repeat domain-containing protein n=1 Tax=Actinomadura madurae TaxID=1993 RepID=UPI0020D22F37|nr:hypothetical protein [Actinomadura madurae]MCP9980572.1 hypothetical protein [Actinomadura madurae]